VVFLQLATFGSCKLTSILSGFCISLLFQIAVSTKKTQQFLESCKLELFYLANSVVGTDVLHRTSVVTLEFCGFFLAL